MEAKNSNPIVRLLQAARDVAHDYLTRNRAVSINDVFMHLQNELDKAAQPQVGEDGTMTEPAEGAAFVLDVYAEDQSIFAIITKSDGRLYKVPVTVGDDNTISTGEYEEVSLEFTPTNGRQVSVKRQTDGKVRWFAMPACTSILNRSGEIDSVALFDSFIEYAERTGKYPQLDFYHMGEAIVLGQADWVARDGVGYCVSGLFDDTPIARAAIEALENDKDNYWGLSIEYIYQKEPEVIRSAEGIEIPVYNSGINLYVSLLPEDSAASIFTSISTTQEKNRMKEKVFEALKKLTGDDEKLLEDFVNKLDSVNRQAEGTIHRAGDAVTTTETHVVETSAPAAPAATPPAPGQETRAISPEDLQAILTAPEFEARVMEIYAKAYGMAEEQAAPPTQEQEVHNEPPAPAAEAQPEEAAALREQIAGLEKSIADMSGQLTTLAKGKQDMENDMPARMRMSQVVRPRATRLPGQLADNRRGVDLSAIAAETLDRIGATQ